MALAVKKNPADCLEAPQMSDAAEEDIKSRIQDFGHWACGLGAAMEGLEVRQSPQVRMSTGTIQSQASSQAHHDALKIAAPTAK